MRIGAVFLLAPGLQSAVLCSVWCRYRRLSPGFEVSRLVLMCGLAGAGKSTFARALESTGWLRLSIDVAAWEQGHTAHPLPSGVRDAIVAMQRAEIRAALGAGRDVVVDYAFWSRAMRDEYRELGRVEGGEVTVVFCDAPIDELRRRLRGRSHGGASADAVEVSDDLLDQFASGFERPGPDETDVRVVTSQRER